MAVTSITVKHNMEVAHRLFETPGKCENIHGHSMWVTLTLWGEVDSTGKLNGLDFGQVKREFRAHLDKGFDHRLILNHRDTLCSINLPGLRYFEADPTTENLAAYIGEWAERTFKVTRVRCTIDETPSNSATWER